MQGLLIAQKFADALDAEDYLAAEKLLAPDCVYHIGDATFAGPARIVDSYRANSDSATRRFDSVEYDSSVTALSPLSAMILFTDRVRIADQWHEFHCQQCVQIGLSGLIAMIRHEELEIERTRLIEFENRMRNYVAGSHGRNDGDRKKS
jgi:hypothetical protein